MSPAVIIGPVPSSITVPRDDAMIIRAQYRGSAPFEERMPYSGSCEQTAKIIRHARFITNRFLRRREGEKAGEQVRAG